MLTLLAACAPSPGPVTDSGPLDPPIVISGFTSPESAIYDPDQDVVFVTNLGGFVSRVLPDGTIDDLSWIAGLTSPKGTALDGDDLVLVDGAAIRRFDRFTGAPGPVVDIAGAVFLNDVTLGPDGLPYVTQTGSDAETSAVWRLDPGGPTTLATWPVMDRPNGLVADATGVIVIGFDEPVVFHLDLAGARTERFVTPAAHQDGVVLLPDGALLVSSQDAQEVWHLDPDGTITTLIEDLVGPADIGWDPTRERVLVPQLSEGTVQFVPVRLP